MGKKKVEEFLPFSLHVALTTCPVGKEYEFSERVKDIYSNFKRDTNSYLSVKEKRGNSLDDFLYQPLVFYLFGHYDIAFISLIDCYKFAQQVFESELYKKNGKTNLQPSSYQILTGSIFKYNEQLELEKYFTPFGIDKKYVEISNLKLSNGLLIGNGDNYSECVVKLIDSIFSKKYINDVSYIIVNSFNWCELTLIMFSDSIDPLISCILEVRKLKLNDLRKLDSFDKIKAESLFCQLEVNMCQGRNPHLVSDTHSFFGLNYNFLKDVPQKFVNDELKTITEWQVKPGHLPYLINNLRNPEHEIFDFDSIYFKNGKTDYCFKSSDEDSLCSNIKLYKQITDKSDELVKHFRKIKTLAFFKLPNDIKEALKKDLKKLNEKKDYLPIEELLSKFQIKEIAEIRQSLKKLNLSRQIREKICKVFVNYNAGISDPILYIYFIDFRGYLEYFKFTIFDISKEIDKYLENKFDEIPDDHYSYLRDDSKLEELFTKYLDAFEEAYHNRVFNNYFYEDISDFDIDFNSSITQILISYDSIIKLLSQSFLREEHNILVRQNDLNTESNLVSINYNVHHLIEPSLVFATISKELANSMYFILKEKQNDELESWYNNIISELNGKLSPEIYEDFCNIFNLEYYTFDIIKYLYTYNANTELYVFWSWVYMLQNTSMYTPIGFVEEEKFHRELIRILLIVMTFDPSFIHEKKFVCPIPELYDYWERYCLITINVVTKLLSLPSLKVLQKEIIENFFQNILFPENFKSNKKTIGQKVEDEFQKISIIGNHDYLKDNQYDIFASICHAFIDDKLDSFPFKNRHLIVRYFSKKIFEDFAFGKKVIYNSIEFIAPSVFLNSLSYGYLSWIYENTKEIHLLRRDWINGNVMIDFLKAHKMNSILIDPNGGFFSVDKKTRIDQMRLKNAVLHSIWHLGMVYKKELFKMN